MLLNAPPCLLPEDGRVSNQCKLGFAPSAMHLLDTLEPFATVLRALCGTLRVCG